MLDTITRQNQAVRFNFNRTSQPAFEVSQFMKNFFEAVRGGDLEEISSYYSDEMEPFSFPLNADWIDEIILADEHLATFSCTLRTAANLDERLSYVLDKSEGYWQIIHGEAQQNSRSH